jgi:hypothetical protein
MGLDRRHHRYSSGSDALQSTNSFTSFINVIDLIFLLGEVKTCRLLASIITGQFLNKLCNIVTFLFLTNHMTYLLFFLLKFYFKFISINIYSKYYRFPLSFSEVLSQFGKQIKRPNNTVLVPGIVCVVFHLVNENK